MSKIPILLTIVLIWIWAYTSWYWYVCNIKWLCNLPQVQTHSSDTTILRYWDVTWQNIQPEEDEVNQTGSSEEITGTGELYNSPKLSADDVLQDNPRPKREEVVEEEKEEIGVNVRVLSGSTDIEKWDSSKKEDTEDQLNLCENPLVWPIGLGWNNSEWEVKKLEAFLISRGERVEINGRYEQDDFEAMKRFQWEYKSEVLTPWWIENPTGYVGKTTVKKINELACE